MKHLYGEFTKQQIKDQKKQLHSSIHWLLIYKEENYELLDRYFTSLLYRISGLNELFRTQPEIVTLISVLQSAKTEAKKEDFDFNIYRKLIFDAHSLVDKIREDDLVVES